MRPGGQTSPGKLACLRIFCLRLSPVFQRCPSRNPPEIPLSSAQEWPLIIDEPGRGRFGGGLDVTEPNEESPLPSFPSALFTVERIGVGNDAQR